MRIKPAPTGFKNQEVLRQVSEQNGNGFLGWSVSRGGAGFEEYTERTH